MLFRSVGECRGFRFDFDSVTPGPKVRTPEQLAGALSEVMVAMKQGDSGVDSDYARIRDFFHAYCDNRSAERAYDSIVTRFSSEQI